MGRQVLFVWAVRFHLFGPSGFSCLGRDGWKISIYGGHNKWSFVSQKKKGHFPTKNITNGYLPLKKQQMDIFL
jgi:hypothetical protein